MKNSIEQTKQIEKMQETKQIEKTLISTIIGFCIGFLAAIIMLNVAANYEIEKNPEITLDAYWNSK